MVINEYIKTFLTEMFLFLWICQTICQDMLFYFHFRAVSPLLNYKYNLFSNLYVMTLSLIFYMNSTYRIKGVYIYDKHQCCYFMFI